MDQFKKALKIYFAMILFTIVIAALYSEMEYKLLFLVPFIVLFYSRYKYINFFKDRSFVSVVQLTSNEKHSWSIDKVGLSHRAKAFSKLAKYLPNE